MKFSRLVLLAAIVASYGIFICAADTNPSLSDLPQNDEVYLAIDNPSKEDLELFIGKNESKEENVSIEKLRNDKEIAQLEAQLVYCDKRNKWIVIGILGSAAFISTTYLLNKVITLHISSS